MYVDNNIDGHVIYQCSGSSWRMFTAEEAETQEDVTRRDLGKEGNGDTPIGYSGQTALRREQCDGSAQGIAGQQPGGTV
jgi:hypothetical protein